MINLLKRAVKKTRIPWLIDASKYIYYFGSGCKYPRLTASLKRKCQSGNYLTAGPVVSILCNVWNTEKSYLTEMLDSVLSQTYANWELCINNCSDEEHSYIDEILSSYAVSDSRVKIFRHSNMGIAENTNAVSKHATGDFILLLDHDDILAPHCISELIRTALAENADFVYADEFVYLMKYNICLTVRKKAFSIETLRTHNYINHPALIRKGLFDSIGGLRNGFQGSQDHELYFRIVENTSAISHVSEPLYFWRINRQSFSKTNMQSCVASGKKALEEHLERMNIKASVSVENPDEARYRIN